MRVLVTGSEGFIASHLPFDGHVLRLDLKNGDDIRREATAERIKAFDPEVVFHLAAHHFIPWCDANPVETERTNVVGTAVVLAACGPSLRAFILASSAAVYGYSPSPIAEDHPLAGTSVYAHTKQKAELMLERASLEMPGRFVAARLFNAVGTGDSWAHVLPSIVGNLDEDVYLGNTWPQRDYVHVDDVGEALLFLSEKAPKGFSAWNVGTGVGTTVTELVARVGDLAGKTIKTRTYAGRIRTDDGHLVANPGALAVLGWEAKRSLNDAIKDVLA